MSHQMTRNGVCARPDGHNGQHLSADALANQYALEVAWLARRRQDHRFNAAENHRITTYRRARRIQGSSLGL